MAISDSYLTELRQKNDIENIISSYVNLKRNGRIMKGLCPFHNEKTPSFTVYPETQSYYCFGCGAGGDVITFIRTIDNLDYVEAVKLLAEKVGMSLPQENFDDGLSKRRQRMFEANREAARFFHKTLYSENGKVGLKYFYGRGLTDETIKLFGLGFAPNKWDELYRHMSALGFTAQELYEANLLNKSNKDGKIRFYDTFRNRVMFPIIDVRGNVIAFGGRVLEDIKPKYLNTADTLVYKKSHGVFALNLAKNGNNDKLILCEGYMDVIALHQAGFTNSVAGLGTALTEEQAGLLARYAGEILLSYDADEAGQKAANRAIGIFSKTGARIKVLHLTGGKDPDEIIKVCGKEKFRAIIDGAANDIEFKLLAEKQKYDVTTSDGKLNFLKAAVDILASLNDDIEKDIYSTRLSEELSVTKTAITEQIKQKSLTKQRKQQKLDFNSIVRTTISPKDSINLGRGQNPRATKAEDVLIANLMANPDFLNKINDKISSDVFVTDFNAKIFKVIAERIEGNRSYEPIFLGEEFSVNEMSRVVRLQNMNTTISNTLKECEDCIKVIIEEKNKKIPVNIGNLSDDDFLSAFKDINK